jgi:hypothetical protein
MYPAPKIIIRRAKKIFTHYFIISFLPIIIIFIVLLNKKILLSETVGYATIALTIIFLLISLFYTFKIWKSKEKTIYKFIIRTQILNLFVMPSILISNSISDIMNIGVLGYIIIVAYYSRTFYKRHQQEKEKYKLLVTV